ncbi:MAG: lipopolysaccharide heptosyltransferase II [Candidatus Omnitrophica bacterium]|nr:lipopolysaccharide heptosyltransferase II [Candidatus Omnitrophota bacterium]
MEKESRNILVVSVNWLGDAVMLTPGLKAVKERFPASRLSVMCVTRLEEFFSGNPYVDEVLVFDEKTHHAGIKAKIEYSRNLRARNFDIVFCVQRSLTRLLLCALAGIPERVGYSRRKTALLLTHRVSDPGDRIHRQDRYCLLFEHYGIPVREKMNFVSVPEFARSESNALLSGVLGRADHLVGVQPSANWDAKRWPPQRFAAVCDKLIREKNCAVVCIGTEGDRSVVEQMSALMEEPLYNLLGKTTLLSLCAVLEHCDLFLSNDSGPAHVSAGLGIPTVVLFGPTDARVTGPRGSRVKVLQKPVSCTIPCYRAECARNMCMEKIEVDEVYRCAVAQLGGIQEYSRTE